MGWQSALSEWVEEPHKLGHLLGFTKLSSIHSVWINYFLHIKPAGEFVLQAHRNAYKTTAGLVAITLLYLIYPNIRILIVRKTISNAEKLIMAIQKIFESEIIRAWCIDRHFLTDVKTEVWSRAQITFAFKKTITLEPSLQATGIGNSMTGAHYDYIWSDDIVTDADRWSTAERDSTKNYIYELGNIIEPLGSRIYTGTPWHSEDAFSILPEPVKYPIGSIDIIGIDAEWVAHKKLRTPNSLWCANYELRHVDDSDMIGAFETITHFTAQYKVAFLDTSFSDSSKSDRTALAIVGFARDLSRPHDYWRIEFTGKSWQKSITNTETIIDMIRFLDTHRPVQVEVESQLGDSTQTFIDRFKQAEKDLHVNPRNHWTVLHQTKNKHERIMLHVAGNKDRLRVLDSTDEAFLNPIISYTKKADHDDEADSLAGAINLWQTSPVLKNYIHLLERQKMA